MSNIDNFRKYFKEIRGKKSLRQIEEESGVSRSFLSKFESGIRGRPSPEILEKLAPALDVSYNELMEKAGYIKTYTDSKEIMDNFYETVLDSLSGGFSNLKEELAAHVKHISKTEGVSEKEVYTKLVNNVIDKVRFNEENNTLEIFYFNNSDNQLKPKLNKNSNTNKNNLISLPSTNISSQDKAFFDIYYNLNERNKGKAELYMEQLLKEQEANN